jgi:hypothetical protein
MPYEESMHSKTQVLYAMQTFHWNSRPMVPPAMVKAHALGPAMRETLVVIFFLFFHSFFLFFVSVCYCRPALFG